MVDKYISGCLDISIHSNGLALCLRVESGQPVKSAYQPVNY
jgi:hypothetical protein